MELQSILYAFNCIYSQVATYNYLAVYPDKFSIVSFIAIASYIAACYQ